MLDPQTNKSSVGPKHSATRTPTTAEIMTDVDTQIAEKWVRLRDQNTPALIQRHYPFGYDEYRAKEWRGILSHMIDAQGAKHAFCETLKALGIFDARMTERLK